MTNEPTSIDENDPTNTGSSSTAPLNAQADSDTGTGSGTKDPTGVEGANPALDDTGNLKAAETGEAPEAPENTEDLDLTPQGLSDEPAKQEDDESLAKPDNS
ncbi:hypothetical protein D7Z96_19855 [Pseudarthrobacter phenanthrenivorans]|uniref:Uncharacterized protein n=2 Tax=Pseudarthrobacter phenanthrenivorans TaxID=361575 RepID=A0A3B0FJH0_PSEPS|nr:hypothetical protein [Pseudarthrobacter phenanthrenivorans]ADX74280.1 hypothetical protein Asphe3_31720 [Pseudarthrobacter phenanthrenivorans Sphe3]RKO19838.1 hypothetical protein D7Z96_19855 [Pseudarthrobacter phenanthrenivorans]TPV52472.1 hypothetical protein FJ661_03970 [Pseudarthrobacter phenanthrenivorans]